MNAVDELALLMADRGQQSYGENVTIAEHALLTAAAAEARGEGDTLIAACLLHDVGHWLGEPDDAFGIHTHDQSGGDWVAKRFPEAVAEPVRLHVAAKRYLCNRDPSYHNRLSAASQYTLTKQGGPMSDVEAAEFDANTYANDAVRLRQLEDDHGKVTDVEVPSLSHFAPLLERLQRDPRP